MSIGHRPDADELSDASIYELYSALGEKDTPRLYQEPYALDTSTDCPFGAGNSLDRKIKVIDRQLYAEVMDGAFRQTGLTSQQIIDLWLDHEHTEKCIADGDNPCDSYAPCHERALRKEHEGLLAILGRDNARAKIDAYEAAIWPSLERCYSRPVKNVRKDLWLAPLFDEPDDRDEEIVRRMQSLGVIDAFKHSKRESEYGMAQHRCGICRFWHPQFIHQAHGELAACHRVSGLVRLDRGCKFWKGHDPHEVAAQRMGARRAPDGMYYLPDKDRAGKYLRVEPGNGGLPTDSGGG